MLVSLPVFTPPPIPGPASGLPAKPRCRQSNLRDIHPSLHSPRRHAGESGVGLTPDRSASPQVNSVDYQRNSALTCTDTPLDRQRSVTVCERLADFLRTDSRGPPN